ncbi:MAG: glutamate--tRNA ligase [Candidatus Wildermuthbacteria bacterium]|nr:glutamate--tRNA ligase [Candidatus Wildermuthbacteria bacterium]
MEAEIKRVRARFAPSPTGPFHMGSARTALFNYLFARSNGGDFIVRAEDTDKERSERRWEDDMAANLRWLGIEALESPAAGGPYAPYRQSERTALYRGYLERLIEEDKAYYCFCTKEELEAQKQSLSAAGETPRYTGKCRALSREEQERRMRGGEAAVIRFATPSKTVAFHDIIRGALKFETSLIGDMVLAKDLETPLYNFTVVVDDYEMRITHVIRGEDHISNTPKQILLQEALGFPSVVYAHLPLLLGEDRAKLSKRHGDNSVTRFREEGYLPEAVVNFLALLGWNPGSEKEIFSLDDLVKEFELERVQKGGAIFNVKRLDWINGFYIRQKPLEELARLCVPYLIAAGLLKYEGDVSDEKLQNIVGLYRERLKKLSEIGELVDYFFKETLEYEPSLLHWKKESDEETAHALDEVSECLSRIPVAEWGREEISKALLKAAEAHKDRGHLLWPARAALTGKEASAGPFDVAAVMGREKTLQRIREARMKFQNYRS